MYKVFIDNKEVHFVDLTHKKSKKRFEMVVFADVSTPKPFLKKVQELQVEKVLIVVCSDPEKDFKKLFQSYKKITTGGGVVRRKQSVLAIYRLGKWDLPKGKLEKNEVPEIAAYREIEEECGINGHMLVDKICETYHTYEEKGEKYLKRNHWFYFIYKGLKELTPQTEEDISEAQWMKIKDLANFNKNSYSSILSVLKSWKKKFG